MITRGIIEQIVNAYTVKVRMPAINDMGRTGKNLLSDDLNDAKICTLSHVNPSLNIGDIVFVAFEDNDMGKPVVIGHLYRENMQNTYTDIQSNSLIVNLMCQLPEYTSIGEVTSKQIAYLKNVNYDLQSQIDRLTNIVNDLEREIESLKERKGG